MTRGAGVDEKGMIWAMRDEVHVYFATPLVIDFNKLKPAVIGRFTVQVNNSNLTHSGENMAETFQVGHYVNFSVQWQKPDKSPAPVEGATMWSTTDAGICTIHVSEGNPLIANGRIEGSGACQIIADADADLGEGVVPVRAIFDVVGTDMATGGVITATDMGSGPPPGQ